MNRIALAVAVLFVTVGCGPVPSESAPSGPESKDHAAVVALERAMHEPAPRTTEAANHGF